MPEKLNSLVTAYKSKRSEDNFRAIYDLYEPQWSRSVHSDAKRACTDKSSMLALYHDALMNAIEKWDITLGDFANYLARWVSRARANLQRTSIRRLNKQDDRIIRDESGEDAPTSLLDRLTDDRSAEDHVFEQMYKKKEADKLALIDFLSDQSKVDNVTTVIVTNFSQYKSVNDLAKGLGIHHETVKRKLTALSRRFDANRFGEIRDYLAV